jgi:hypothetical protein
MVGKPYDGKAMLIIVEFMPTNAVDDVMPTARARIEEGISTAMLLVSASRLTR